VRFADSPTKQACHVTKTIFRLSKKRRLWAQLAYSNVLTKKKKKKKQKKKQKEEEEKKKEKKKKKKKKKQGGGGREGGGGEEAGEEEEEDAYCMGGLYVGTYQKSDATIRDRTVPISLRQFQVDFLMALQTSGFYCTQILFYSN